MKILVISSYLPYPLYSGGHVRLYNLLKELANFHEITLICEMRSNQSEEDVKEVEKICKKVITAGRRRQWSLGNIIATLLSNHSFLITGHTNRLLRSYIQKEIKSGQYDLIHVETFYVAQNIPSLQIPVVLVEHNIEYQVYLRYAKLAPFFLRPLLYFDIYKLRREEEKFWKMATAVVAVSAEEKETMRLAGINAKIAANGVDTEQFYYKNIKAALSKDEKRILFIGDFKWVQNRDTLTWIIKDIWPLIKKNVNSKINIKLWVVGRNIPKSIMNQVNDKDIIFDGESSVRPARELFQEAYVTLTPIRVGGGTSYKILESMACGTPAIITPLSAKGLGIINGDEALVGDTSSELADNTIKLLQDHEIYEKISKSGRALIERKYIWKAIARDLNDVYVSASAKSKNK